MTEVLKKTSCPSCKNKGRDLSNDNLVVYKNGGSHCFSCGYTVLSDDYKLEHGLLDQVYEHEEEGNTLMFQDKWNHIKNKTRPEGKGFRGIRDDIYAKFGVRHEYHTVLQKGEETEELVAQYYPLTTTVDDDTQVCGVKVRQIPKKFRAEGLNKKDKTHLFGQVNFLNSLSKTVVITSGECFPPDVEVMTSEGFKRFDQLTKNEQILQINEDMSSTLVTPLAYIEKDYEGDLIEINTRTYRTICTPNHNIVYLNKRNDVLKIKAKDKLVTSWKYPIVTKYEGEGIPLTNDQIALLLAVCADSKLDYRVNSNYKAHFAFTKDRKIQRLKGLLERLDITYSSYQRVYSGKNYTTFNLTLPDWITSKTIPFDWVLKATQVQREFILSELLHWDGNYSKEGWYEFTSKHFSECDTVYQLLILSGRYGNVRERSNQFGTWYVTSWCDSGKPQDGQPVEKSKQTYEYKGKVYCVSVPSGMILTRYNGRTAVIGNCDLLATYQMLFDALGQEQCPAVVSGTCGEGAVEQYQTQYEFLNKFDKIVIVPDADEAGKKALKKAVQALPKDKVYVLEVPQVYKDPNAMLVAKKEKDFVTLYFRAKPYVPDGIVGSSELYQSLLDMSSVKKIPLPPFLHELEEMLSGGFNLESIINIAASSGLGLKLAQLKFV